MGGVEVQLHALASAINGEEWSASRGSGPRYPLIGWVCPRAGLDAVAKKKKLIPAMEPQAVLLCLR
jgi:hypothetical protein